MQQSNVPRLPSRAVQRRLVSPSNGDGSRGFAPRVSMHFAALRRAVRYLRLVGYALAALACDVRPFWAVAVDRRDDERPRTALERSLTLTAPTGPPQALAV